MFRSTLLPYIIVFLLVTVALALTTAQNPAAVHTIPEVFESWNVTLHDTHPAIHYYPELKSCGYFASWDCALGWKESRYDNPHSGRHLPFTFHEADNYHHLFSRQREWRLSTRGSHIYVYGAPNTHLSTDPGAARFCVGGKCRDIDVYDIYANAQDDGPVLLAFQDDLDPRFMVDVVFTLLARPTGRGGRSNTRSITLQEVVVTEVDIPIVRDHSGWPISRALKWKLVVYMSFLVVIVVMACFRGSQGSGSLGSPPPYQAQYGSTQR